jgi:hypothetical protein
MTVETILAPAGWGFFPGALLACDVRASLPNLPLLSRVAPGMRTQAIGDAIRSVPGLAELVTPADIAHKYGVHRGIARNALLIAQRGGGHG